MRQFLTLFLVLTSCVPFLNGEEYEFVGSHFLASYYGCDEAVLNDKDGLISALTNAVGVSGATLLKIADYQFEPMGVTIVALLSESHASIHTYPEFQACFVDFFTCGNKCDYNKFDESFKEALKAQHVNSQHIMRK